MGDITNVMSLTPHIGAVNPSLAPPPALTRPVPPREGHSETFRGHSPPLPDISTSSRSFGRAENRGENENRDAPPPPAAAAATSSAALGIQTGCRISAAQFSAAQRGRRAP